MDQGKVPGIIIGKLMNLGGMLQSQGNKMLKPFDLNHQQFSIFFEIAKAGEVKQKEMVNRLVLKKSHVSKVVKKLYQMGLITISETDKDKRSYLLSITKKGEATLSQCSEIFRQWHNDWVEGIDEAELSSILENLTTLQTAFKKKTDSVLEENNAH